VNKVVVLNPVGRTIVKAFDVAGRIEGFQGRKIGFIDNMKPNAGLFLQRIGELLRAKAKGIEIVTVRKSITTNMPIAHELEGKVDAVINAWGD
jgi:hypothetical protein